MPFEGDPSNKIEQPKPSSDWITLSPEMFPEGSFGQHSMFPFFTGRRRPSAIFDQSLSSLTKNPNVLSELENNGLRTIRDSLNEPREKITALEEKFPALRKILEESFEDLKITPHARLLQTCLGAPPQSPVPAELETELINAVEKRLAMVDPKRQRILILRFGIEDGIKHSVAEIRKEMDIKEGTIYEHMNRALRSLRYSQTLDGYITLPSGSMAVKEFGIFLKGDLESLFRHIDVWDPAFNETRSELKELRVNIYDLLSGKTAIPASLSDKARQVIKDLMAKGIHEWRTAEEQKRKESERIAKEAKAQPKTKEEIKIPELPPPPPVASQAFPEIEIPAKLYGFIKDISLANLIKTHKLGLDRYTRDELEKGKISTLGEILGLTTKELAVILRTKNNVRAFANYLRRVLNLPASNQTILDSLFQAQVETMAEAKTKERERIDQETARQRSDAIERKAKRGEERQRTQTAHADALRNAAEVRTRLAQEARKIDMRFVYDQSIRPLIDQGITNPRKIQERLIRTGASDILEVPIVGPKAWRATALIEYLLRIHSNSS